MAAGARAYVASKFAFELDGDGVLGFLNSAEGGGLKTEVVDYKQGRLVDVWRQVGRPKFEDITIKVGMGMSECFYKWISDFFNRKVSRKNGGIVMADFNYKQRARRSFIDALISEVQMPALDGASKEAAFMTVKLVPEGMTYETITGDAKVESPESLRQPNKMWHAANFRFAVDGFEAAFARTTKIDGWSIKQQILDYPSGNQRLPLKIPGRLEYPQSLSVYIPAVDAEAVIEQAQKRLLDYDAPPQGGMTGVIELRAPDKSTLCSINLAGVDIVSAEPQKSEASAETLAMVKVVIQCESMRFTYGSGGGGGGAA